MINAYKKLCLYIGIKNPNIVFLKKLKSNYIFCVSSDSSKILNGMLYCFDEKTGLIREVRYNHFGYELYFYKDLTKLLKRKLINDNINTKSYTSAGV